MGHDICSFLDKASFTAYISIVDSASYVPNFDEILICPNRVPDEFENYQRCNVEAGLQRAVFVRSNISSQQQQNVRKIFTTIAEWFGSESENFNFFGTFEGQDDVIFKVSLILFCVCADVYSTFLVHIYVHMYVLHIYYKDEAH